ncbi:MAG: family 16 glycoside hydrolase, partial [Planctomycetota bacterium]
MRFCILFALASMTGALTLADDTYLDPTNAGPDFATQGEYVGDVQTDNGTLKIGLQVIALGKHEFDGVAYLGGLPGDGWDGSEKIRAKGKTDGGETKLVASEEGHAILKDGTATIYSASGEKVGTLKKVERRSPTLGAKPPAGAVVLFDGTSASQFANGKIEMKDLLAADCETKEKFGDHTLHIEFRTPFKPAGRGQDRGNSGVYIQGRYECQVLDS